jgi:RimJ/RimL family protein N-acetyltransferase
MNDEVALRPVREDDDLSMLEELTQDQEKTGEFGITLRAEARGHGYGTQAQRLLARYLFAHTTVHRIWAATEVENIAEQKALEKAGFTREGITRGTGWRDGAWRDGVIYSLLRTDPVV